MTDDKELTIEEMTAILRQRFEGITDDQRAAIAASIKRIVREYADAGHSSRKRSRYGPAPIRASSS